MIVPHKIVVRQKTHLITYAWKNPLLEDEMTYIDFKSDLARSDPFAVANTGEPKK